MAAYHFTTQWRLQAPITPVWEIITAPETWPEWWKGVISVQRRAAGDAAGIGSVYHYVFRSRLPYHLEFEMETVRRQPPTLLEGRATGELAGSGLWQLSEANGITSVQYDWQVRTGKRWMNLLAPVARPLFAWNHDVIMAWGGEGLARRLQTRLLK